MTYTVPDEAMAEIAREQDRNPYYPFLSEPGEAAEAGVPFEYVRVCNTGCAKDAPSIVAFWKSGVPAEWVKDIVPSHNDKVRDYIEAWEAGIPAVFLRLTAFHIMRTRIRLWRAGLRVDDIRELNHTATLPGVLDACALGFPAAALREYSEAGYDVEESARLYDHGVPPGYADAGNNVRAEKLIEFWDSGFPEEYLRAMRPPS